MTELVAKVGVPVYVQVRPRPGDFVYNEDEIPVMRLDVERCLDAGATGVSVGILKEDGHLNLEAMKSMSDIIHQRMGAEFTISRAIDISLRHGVPVEEILEQATELGASRILTSGSFSKAKDGLDMIEK